MVTSFAIVGAHLLLRPLEIMNRYQPEELCILRVQLGRQTMEPFTQPHNPLGVCQLARLGDNGSIGSDPSGNRSPEPDSFPSELPAAIPEIVSSHGPIID